MSHQLVIPHFELSNKGYADKFLPHIIRTQRIRRRGKVNKSEKGMFIC